MKLHHLIRDPDPTFHYCKSVRAMRLQDPASFDTNPDRRSEKFDSDPRQNVTYPNPGKKGFIVSGKSLKI